MSPNGDAIFTAISLHCIEFQEFGMHLPAREPRGSIYYKYKVHQP